MHINPKLTIPTPMTAPRARGVHSLGVMSTCRGVKLSANDNKLICEAADMLGVKKAEFMRWCAVESAKQVLWGKTHG